jgi:hypothetical protein
MALIKKRRELWNLWRVMEEGEAKANIWNEFKEIRREVRRAIGVARQAEWRELGDQLEKSFAENKKVFFWARVKRLNGKSGKCSTGPVKGADGTLVVDGHGKKRVWKEYFESLGKQEDEVGKFDEDFCKHVKEEVVNMEFDSSKYEEES